eukprot:gnl/MRDRNA2_/MRDRNA2_14811_c0_seq2.p1 gnl/MRDRNA2_/MRDRNA2_14811_c0~~gnl/MRDRNA2_/MRDRNA2_14811_c0_seq2.p1  ORF type:complete len:136 (-),score=18.10 gnl/MRDRNA2_/MRDRNA2_14811_c0_seq2:87-494(-)
MPYYGVGDPQMLKPGEASRMLDMPLGIPHKVCVRYKEPWHAVDTDKSFQCKEVLSPENDDELVKYYVKDIVSPAILGAYEVLLCEGCSSSARYFQSIPLVLASLMLLVVCLGLKRCVTVGCDKKSVHGLQTGLLV